MHFAERCALLAGARRVVVHELPPRVGRAGLEGIAVAHGLFWGRRGENARIARELHRTDIGEPSAVTGEQIYYLSFGDLYPSFNISSISFGLSDRSEF